MDYQSIKKFLIKFKNLQSSFNDDAYEPHPLLEKLVAAGRLGKKTGMGIYDWSSGEAEETELPE